MIGRASAYAIKIVRRNAERQMIDSVEIYRPTAPTFNNTTGLMTAHRGSTIYTGKARISVGNASPVEQGDGIIMFTTTGISIPAVSVMPHTDDLVKILAAGQSATVNDLYRIIATSPAGDLGAVITLTCTSEEASPFTA